MAATPLYVPALAMAAITPDPQNRKDHDPEALKSLAAQIEAEGLLQPILVRQLGASSHPQYQIIAGERRWLAHKLLKLPTIRAFVHADETPLSHATKQLFENLGRKDLNPIEEARQFKRLEDLKVTQAEIGKLAGGRSQPAIANTLKLLLLPAFTQGLIETGELTAAHGQELVRFAAWPKVCNLIAAKAAKTEEGQRYSSAKDLRSDALPFDRELVKAGLAIEIYTGSYSYDSRKLYKISDAIAKLPGFIKSGYEEWHYLLPADPKAPNLWNPERDRQDAQRVADAAAAKKAEKAPKVKGAKPSKEQLERKKKLQENKDARAAIDGTLAHAVLELKSSAALNVTALAVVCDRVLGDPEIVPEEAFAAVGMKVPKSADNFGRGEGVEMLRTIAPPTLVKLTAVAVMLSESAGARRFAGTVPASSVYIAGKAAKGAAASSVKVEVRGKGDEYLAKAGEAKASATSAPEHAAKAAAAKHFTSNSAMIDLLIVREGRQNGDTWIYTATKYAKK